MCPNLQFAHRSDLLWPVCDSLDYRAKESATIAADQNLWSLAENFWMRISTHYCASEVATCTLWNVSTPLDGSFRNSILLSGVALGTYSFQRHLLVNSSKNKVQMNSHCPIKLSIGMKRSQIFKGWGGDGGGGGRVFVLEMTELGKGDSGRHVCSKPVTDILLPLIFWGLHFGEHISPF